MTKAGEKLIEAAKDAVNVAKCDHDLTLLPRDWSTTAGPHFDRYRCGKCKGTMWVPIELHRPDY